jgi:Holliday junction DNA helicase RuvA
MFDYFKGFITDKRRNTKGTYLSIEVSGVGYLLEITDRDFDSLSIDEKNLQKMYTYLVHREDNMSLYGFSNKETRDIFQILLSVSGVGAKMAIALLNEFDACDVISLVIDGNFKELTRAKGVGPKLAQKIILELKGKLNSCKEFNVDFKPVVNHNFCGANIEDAQMVLASLGYESKEINFALEQALKSLDSSAGTELILKKALQTLSI